MKTIELNLIAGSVAVLSVDSIQTITATWKGARVTYSNDGKPTTIEVREVPSRIKGMMNS